MRADVSLGILLSDETKLFNRHIKLLKAVDKTGSITKAAQIIGISYKTAWDTLDLLNNKSKYPLLERIDGAKKNSGTKLSEHAHTLIEAFEKLLLLQQGFLDRVLNSGIDIDTLSNLKSLTLALSARNQLNAKIVDIKESELNSLAVCKLRNGELLAASITIQSRRNLDLKEEKDVLLIFKAPQVIISTTKPETKYTISCQIEQLIINPEQSEVLLRVSQDQTITALVSTINAKNFSIGQKIYAQIDPANIIIGV